MIEFIKKNILVIILFIITLFVGFLTFLTFIDKSFIQLNSQNLQYLLGANIVLLLFFSILSSGFLKMWVFGPTLLRNVGPVEIEGGPKIFPTIQK